MGYIKKAKVRQAESNAKTAYNAICTYFDSMNDDFVDLASSSDDSLNKIINDLTVDDGALGTTWKDKVGVAIAAGSNESDVVAIWSADKDNLTGSASKTYAHSTGTGTWASYPMDTEWTGNVCWGGTATPEPQPEPTTPSQHRPWWKWWWW